MYKQELKNHLINENNIPAETVNNMTDKELVIAYIEHNTGIYSYEEFIIVANGAFNVELDTISL